MRKELERLFLGREKNLEDPGIYHRMALIPFLAWVGLGADGLSSSAYGPAEAFNTLGHHTYLAVGLALATALTVLVISASYSQIIRHFPAGGGGYVVATKLLGKRAGVVSGSALLVDYILTITVSIASGADAVFSFLPPSWYSARLLVEVGVIGLLVLLNLRGIKESVIVLVPIFILFLITHVVLIGWGVLGHIHEVPAMVHGVQQGWHEGLSSLGKFGMLMLFLRAYSLGGGTYTGIEAVSNGLAIMREPRVETGKRTMVYMAISLALTAGGILFCYLLLGVHLQDGMTMNAVLASKVSQGWHIGPLHLGRAFFVTTLVAEGALLFVAAQTGFIDGPRVMANMASDSWLPHRFAALSDRLTTQNGVVVMGGAAIAALLYTRGSVDALVVMYSINVFLTFSLSQLGMVRFWIGHRKDLPDWKSHLPINVIGFVMCSSILVVIVSERFLLGGWVTLVVTTLVVALCFTIRRHYEAVRDTLQGLDADFAELPLDPKREAHDPVDPSRPTAAMFVSGYGGLGVHSILTMLRTFPGQFFNMMFISVGVIDSGNFKGASEVEALTAKVQGALDQYMNLARRLGLAADCRFSIGTDVVEQASKLGLEVAKEFPRTVFFSGKLIFEEPHLYHRLLHNETAYAIQHRLQFAGHPMVVLPVRVRARALAERKRSGPIVIAKK